MNFKQAWKYPFRAECRIPILLVPNLLLIGGLIPLLALGMAAMFSGMLEPERLLGPDGNPNLEQFSPGLLAGVIGAALACLLIAVVAQLPISGYYWELINTWQTYGLDAPPPEWKGRFKHYFKAGFHTFLVGLTMMLPYFLIMLSLGLLGPFFMAPYFLAAREQTVGSYFRNMRPGFSLAKERYKPVLIGMYTAFGVAFLYSMFQNLTSMLIILPLFGMLLQPAINTICLHLLTQQFGIESDPQDAPRRDGGKPDPSAAMKADMERLIRERQEAEGDQEGASAPPQETLPENTMVMLPSPEELPTETVLQMPPDSPQKSQVSPQGTGWKPNSPDNPWLKNRGA